jgi:diguanylate cyclase (GGDEF)-like protein/PAS domain S-box-containing protein
MQAKQNPWRLIAVVGLVVVAAAWSLAFWQSDKIEQKLFADAGRRMQATAQAYASHAALSLAVADESLKRLQETLRRDGEPALGEVARIMSREDSVSGGINRVAMVGKDGKTCHTYLNGITALPVDVSDRDYFKAFRDDPRDRILITEPIRGRASGQWIVLFVRPVLADGQFAGVIFVGFDVSQFARLVSTSEEAGLLITLLSEGSQVVARSEASEQMVGRKVVLPPQASGRNAYDLFDPDDDVTRRYAVRNVPDWGMRVVAGMDHRVIQGEIDSYTRIALLPALLLSLLLLPAGLIIRRTARRQAAAERERDKAAARFRTILESMSEGVLLVDAQGKVLIANDAATQWLSVQPGEHFSAALTASGLSLVTEDGNAYAIADPLTYLCLESGLEFDDAWLMETNPEKSLQWLAMHARPMFDEDDAVSGAVITLDDRTSDHVRIADAEMSRTILSRMNDAVLITDARASIIMVNTDYARLTGFTEAELIGKSPHGRSARQDDAFWATVWQSLTQQKKWSGKVWNLKKDGSEYCIWLSISTVLDLRGHVVRYVAVSRDITEQQAKESDLWQRANFDPLTGLANRTRFDDRLAHALMSSARHQQRFAVCYLDLDHFKPVNDTFGHAAGDELLRQVAQRMAACLRKEDTLARIGGDEFALLMPRIDSADGTIVVAEKILAAIALPFELEAGTARIGISLGIAVYPEHGESADALIAAADQALYAAKMGGRNLWQLAVIDPLTDPL